MQCLIRACVALLVGGLCVGCYKHHLGEPNGSDANGWPIDASGDATFDADLDASADADLDASADADLDAGDDAAVDASADAANDADAAPAMPCFVPSVYATLQAALDDATCDPIYVEQTLFVEQTAMVRRGVTISGTNQDVPWTIYGGLGSVIDIAQDMPVTIEHLEITGGVARDQGGGGIHSYGHLTLRHVNVRDNRTDVLPGDSGGGLYQAGGSLRLEGGVVFENNQAGGADRPQAFGGAMALFTDAVFTDLVSIRNNQARGHMAMGGGIALIGGSLRAEHIEMYNNSVSINCTGSTQVAQGAGGALFSAGPSELHDAVFEGNAINAVGSGCDVIAHGGALMGTVDVFDGVATGNSVHALATGAATAYVRGGFAAIEGQVQDSTIAGNEVSTDLSQGALGIAEGGAIACGDCQINRSVLRYNGIREILQGQPVAPPSTETLGASGGAIWATNLTLSDSLVRGSYVQIQASGTRNSSEAARGGGIAIASRDGQPVSAAIWRSSIIESSAEAVSQDAATTATGGGICVVGDASGDVVIADSTIANNHVRADQTAQATASGAALSASGDEVHVRLYNVTITQNRDQSAAATGDAIHLPPAHWAVQNSIVWDNIAGREGCEDFVDALSSILPASCAVADPFWHSDPLLSPLVEVNERCVVSVPAGGGPASHAGTDACLSPLSDGTLDQCGRPRSGACDLGSVRSEP